ncbi:MAG: DNA polymerase III subunit beta [Bacillota bacterium]
MRAIVPQETLAEALSTVSKAVSSKSTIPVLSGVLLEARSDHLLLRATDLELAIEASAAAQVQAEGSIVLPAKLLTDLIRRIPFGDLEIAVDPGHYTATIRWGRSQYLLHGFPADQFPQIPQPGDESHFIVSQPALRDLIRQTSFAAAHDETRPYLTGVYITLSGEQLSGVATDSVRIAHTWVPARNPQHLSVQAIVPSRSLNELARVLSTDPEAEARVAITGNQAFFDLGSVRVISRLLEGQYPDVLRLIPQSYGTRATLNKEQFLEAVERAALTTKDGAIKLEVGPDAMVIRANTPEVAQVQEELPLTLEGDPLEIGFNARYLIEGLKVLDDPDFLFEFSGSRNPSRISGTTGTSHYLYVVLPLITY